MAIHYRDHGRFSKGQGFIGAACRPVSAQATSKRWFAVDCRDCKRTLMGRWIVSDAHGGAVVVDVHSDGVDVVIPSVGEFAVKFDELDKAWSPAAAEWNEEE